jgi:hypothetical protein
MSHISTCAKSNGQNSILEARNSARYERAPRIPFALVAAYLLVARKMLRPAAKKKKQNIPMSKTIAMSKRIGLKRSMFVDSDDDMK